jgi:hypothetical protein
MRFFHIRESFSIGASTNSCTCTRSHILTPWVARFEDVSLMPFELGTCPCCGTENSVFRGVKPLLLQTLGEQALDRRESAAYVVDWKCRRCGRQFQTQEMLQGADRAGA